MRAVQVRNNSALEPVLRKHLILRCPFPALTLHLRRRSAW